MMSDTSYSVDNVSNILDLKLIPDELKSEELVETFKKFKKQLKPLINSRAALKRKITYAVKEINNYISDTDVDVRILNEDISLIVDILKNIEMSDKTILDSYHDLDLNEISVIAYDKELQSQVSYLRSVKTKLSEFRSVVELVTPSGNSQNIRSDSEVKNLTRVRPPEIHCPMFYGKSNEDFRTFWVTFESAFRIHKNLTEADKLLYLRSYLGDNALKTIQHLSISDGNFKVAKGLLEKEYFDRDFYLDGIIKQILAFEFVNPTYESFRDDMNSIRSYLYELEGLNINFLDVNNPNGLLLSHILFGKCPKAFNLELIRISNTSFPTLSHIVDNFTDIIRRLERNKISIVGFSRNKLLPNKVPNKLYNTYSKPKFVRSNSDPMIKGKGNGFQKPSLHSFKTITHLARDHSGNVSRQMRLCKFCSGNHRYYQCNEYSTLSQRRTRARSLNLCQYCLSGVHISERCPGLQNKLSYKCFTCQGNKHISAMCDQMGGTATELESTNLCFASIDNNQSFLLPLLEIQIGRGRHIHKVLCLIDSGSTKSYITSDLAHALGVDSKSQTSQVYDIKTFTNTFTKRLSQQVFDFYMTPSMSPFQLPVLVDPDMNLNLHIKGLKTAINNIKLKGFHLACDALNNLKDDSISNIHALIGIDLIQFMPTWQLQRLDPFQGSGFHTACGMVPCGNIKYFLDDSQIKNLYSLDVVDLLNKDSTITTNNMELILNNILCPNPSYPDIYGYTKSSRELDFEVGLEKMFSLETIGIPPNVDQSNYDQVKLREFESNISFSDGKYHIELPWLDNVDRVQSNYHICLKALDRVQKDLYQNNLFSDYNNQINNMLNDNIIEQFDVSPEKYNEFVRMPHRYVLKDETTTTTRLRIVYNASLKTKNNVSLNETSYQGPDLLNSLLKLLLQFRSHKYVLLGDIKKAYLQVKLTSLKDRSRLCFFWKEHNQIKCYRFRSCPFGLRSSGFCLNFIIKHHAKKYPDDICADVMSNYFYSDNMIFTHSDYRVHLQIYDTLKQRMSQAGFDMRWSSNVGPLKTIISDEGVGTQHDAEYEKVLGYKYNIISDSISFSDIQINSEANTKRQIVSESAKIFDPLGLISPISVRCKILIRALWIEALSWDDIVYPEHKKIWRLIAEDLNKAKNLSLPRNAIDNGFNANNNIDIFLFVDASKACYGCCFYTKSDVGTNLIFSKVRVAPDKGMTVPQMELLPIYLGMKCLYTMLDALTKFKVNKVFIFSDSQLALSWAIAEHGSIARIFTKNRAKDIKDMKSDLEFKYKIDILYRFVPTEYNAADCLTRGLTYKQFVPTMDFYFRGPSWLILEEYLWPKSPLKSISDTTKLHLLSGVVYNNQDCNDMAEDDHVLDIYKFSRFKNLMKVKQNVFRFITKLKKLDSNEVNSIALKYLIKCSQNKHFHEEINFLKSNRYKSKHIPELVSNLNLFLDDDNILRSKGRIAKCNYFEYATLCPILLPRQAHFTKLLIMYYHEQVCHLGLSSTLQKIRLEGYWVPNARQALKQVLSNCFLCKKFNAMSFRYPKMTNLPVHRMSLVRPFGYCGVDYTGAVYLTDQNGDSNKYYIVIITCMTTRAIWLDLVPNISTLQFVNSFKRFCATYGIPQVVYSDNQLSFIQGGQILERALKSSDFADFLERSHVKHIRIPVKSAWFGALWERLIKTVKLCLYKCVGRQKLSYFDMLTVLTSIADAVNSRPLTYRSSNIDDIQPICPNDFIKIYNNKQLVYKEALISNAPPHTADHNTLNESLFIMQELFEQFREHWAHEYLLSLRELSKDLFDDAYENRIKVGDVVLIKDNMKSRPFWNLARVVELIFGDDQKIRTVRVVKTSKDQPSLHPISHLYPMELSITHSGRRTTISENNDDTTTQSADKTLPHQNPRPRRKAAEKQMQMMQDKMPDLI